MSFTTKGSTAAACDAINMQKDNAAIFKNESIE
jgi:hypothetical protein